MAVANSVSACNNGVGLIQGTINGIGERTGNADLCSIIPSLSLHVRSEMGCNERLPELTKLSRYVDEILNRTPNSAAPFVGASAFAHKGGLHVAAMKRSPLSYQHIEPERVGNEKRILISELSGRENILGKMQEAGVYMDGSDASVASERALAILNRVKELEAVGYTFEGAEASVHLMILHSTKGYCPPFQVLDYAAQVYDSNMDSASRVLARLHSGDGPTGRQQGLGPTARATVKVRTAFTGTGDNAGLAFDDRLEVADGNGPVDALANALKRALLPSQPYLAAVELVDYKVRILDPVSATAAATRVMIEFRDSYTDTRWTTVSVDTNVISASLNALIDGFEYALIEHAESCMLCDDFF
jgi:2-isopropylmalate synthase